MQRPQVRNLAFFAALAASTSPAAQQILWHAVGEFGVRSLAGAMAFVGDIDGDGFEDLVDLGGLNGHSGGAVFVLSGRTGRLLRTNPVPSGYNLLRLDRAGDWDGDGVGDYAVTRFATQFPTDPTLAEVRSGRDDSVLFQAAAGRYLYEYGGNHLLSDLDTDGDGRPDLIVSVDRETSQNGALYVYANNGQLRYRVAVGCCNTNLGRVGDIDGDGCDDFGYADAAIDGVRVASGRTGATLLEVRGDLPNDHLGLGGITACGDVDGDGVSDFVVSGSGRYPNNGVVRVVSGRDGSPLFTFRKAFPPYGSAFAFGEVIASGFDLDQDGIQDLVVGECQYDCDAVRQLGDRLFVYLLRDGREIEICTPGLDEVQWFTQFGLGVAMGKPHPGDTFPVFAAGENRYGLGASPVSHLGRITLFRLPPSTLRPEGPACRGTLRGPPRIGAVDLGAVGVRVHLSEAPAGAPAVLLAGLSNHAWGGIPLPLKLDPWRFTGCALSTSVLATVPLTAGRLPPRVGYAHVDLPLPVMGSISPRMVHVQWLVLGAGSEAPGALSAALGWPY